MNRKKLQQNDFERHKQLESIDQIKRAPQTELNKFISRNIVGSPQMFKIKI